LANENFYVHLISMFVNANRFSRKLVKWCYQILRLKCTKFDFPLGELTALPTPRSWRLFLRGGRREGKERKGERKGREGRNKGNNGDGEEGKGREWKKE